MFANSDIEIMKEQLHGDATIRLLKDNDADRYKVLSTLSAFTITRQTQQRQTFDEKSVYALILTVKFSNDTEKTDFMNADAFDYLSGESSVRYSFETRNVTDELDIAFGLSEVKKISNDNTPLEDSP